jgi:hypothetical protein
MAAQRDDEQIQAEPGQGHAGKAFGPLSGGDRDLDFHETRNNHRAPVRVLRFVIATQLPRDDPA